VKAARIHAFRGDLELDDVEEPETGPGEVLVGIRAVGLNPLDLWVAEGSVAGGSQPLPFVLGVEAVGTVDGRRVVVNGGGLGTARQGLLSEVAAVPGELAVDVPDGVDDAQAASVSVVGITAKRIVDVGAAAPDDIVVVLGASGGVGSVAVQVAKLAGCRVVAVTGSDEKRAWVEGLGADVVLTAPAGEVASALKDAVGRLADVVLNPLGGESVGHAVGMLEPGGRQVLFGRSAGDRAEFSTAALYRTNISIVGFGGLADDPALQVEARTWLFEQIAAGRLTIPVGAEFPLERAGEGFDMLRSGKAQGKAIVWVEDRRADAP
jgi:NADPH2:quinone reductase